MFDRLIKGCVITRAERAEEAIPGLALSVLDSAYLMVLFKWALWLSQGDTQAEGWEEEDAYTARRIPSALLSSHLGHPGASQQPVLGLPGV